MGVNLPNRDCGFGSFAAGRHAISSPAAVGCEAGAQRKFLDTDFCQTALGERALSQIAGKALQ